MKNSIKALVLGVVLATASLSSVAAEAAQKIGYIHTAKVLQSLPQAKVAMQKIQAEFKDRIDELKQLDATRTSKIEKLTRDHSLMAADEIEKLKLEIQEQTSSLKIKKAGLDQAINRRQVEENQKMLNLVQDAIKVVAEKEKFDLILDSQALGYAKPEFDVSDKVLKAIK